MRLGNTGEGPPEDPECGRPLDLSALRADDALLDALGAGLVRPDEPYAGCPESDRELVALLAAWVAQVRPDEADPLPELDPHPEPAQLGGRSPLLAAVPALTASAPVPPPAPATEERHWVLVHFGRRVAAAALIAALASSGLAFGIAQPDPGAAPAVSRVAFAERARSIAAAAQVTDELQTARTALEQGRREDAARLIAAAGDQLPAVRADDGRAELDRDHRRLQGVLAASGGPPAAGDLVLAGKAPEIEPSDFLGNLADDNDILRDPPTAGGSHGAGHGATDVILADGPASGSADRTPPASAAADQPAAAAGSDDAPSDDPVTSESSASTGDTASASGDTAPSDSSTAADDTASSDGSTTASDDSTSSDGTTAGDDTTSADDTTSSDAPSNSDQSAGSDGSDSSDGPADTPSTKPTSAPKPKPAADQPARETSPTSRPAPTSTPSDAPAAAQSPVTTPEEPSTTNRSKPRTDGANTRPKSTSPQSQDFIGPVQELPTEPVAPPATTSRHRTTDTAERSSTRTGPRTSSVRSSRTSSADRSSTTRSTTPDN